MLAQLTSIVLSSSFRAPEERFPAERFYLTPDPDARPRPAQGRSRAAIADSVRNVFLGLMKAQAPGSPDTQNS